MKHHPTVYQRIRDAAEKGAGLRLTVHDVAVLIDDDAIAKRADMDDHNEAGIPDHEVIGRPINPSRN